MNRLSSDLRAGCTVPVDVTGITYDALHSPLNRRDNYPWQIYLQNYLFSGRSFVVARGHYDQLARYVSDAIASQPELAEGDGLVLHAGDGPS
jgi:hypothetical protein